jgi:adenine-specific DNA-methyltransferase
MTERVALKSMEPDASAWLPFRPVQYLGSKLRVLEEIRSAASSLIRPGAQAVDLFTGTTVVAQHLASAGARVTAVDTQQYAQIFGTALLGVGRTPGEDLDDERIVASALEQVPATAEPWRKANDLEAEALLRADAATLRQLYKKLPLAWQVGEDSAQPLSICTVYAGTYFGVRQALEIDLLHSAIRRLTREGRLSAWQSATAMTGLMHAASMVVHSAGKHFAQPLGEGSGNARFLNARLLSDRSISVFDRFSEGCRRASENPFSALNGHGAVCAPAEEYVLADQGTHQLYYLDPPYTAQQYSRFYHVLETLADDGEPKVPLKERPSAGLYPVGRYKSAFSSRRMAPRTMEALLTEIARRGAAALISYSASAAGSDGNARMVTLEELLGICCGAFGTANVECSRMSHRYRQFNNAGNANDKRDDSEILILCKSA